MNQNAKEVPTQPTARLPKDGLYRILSLDGGGAKGFYTLGVLREVEGLVGARLHEKFDLIFGTSTGAIIAAMLALGHSIDEIHELYKKHVVSVMALKKPAEKSARLKVLADEVFAGKKFEDVKTGIGIVTTKWLNDRPMVFKASKEQAHGRLGTFKPGFGCTIADAVVSRCFRRRGKYANATNTYGDSDIDVVVLYKDTFYKDMSSLSLPQQQAHEHAFGTSTYQWSDLARIGF